MISCFAWTMIYLGQATGLVTLAIVLSAVYHDLKNKEKK
jgi:hypothetical protein